MIYFTSNSVLWVPSAASSESWTSRRTLWSFYCNQQETLRKYGAVGLKAINAAARCTPGRALGVHGTRVWFCWGGSAFSPSGTHENQHENHNMSPFAKLGSVGRPGVDKKRRRTVRRMLLKSRQFQRRRRRVFRQLLEEPLEWRILLTSVTGVNPPANSHSAQVSTDVAA